MYYNEIKAHSDTPEAAYCDDEPFWRGSVDFSAILIDTCWCTRLNLDSAWDPP